MSLFQYQALAEPLQVDTPDVTVYLDWNTQEPDRIVPRARSRPGFFVQPLEPTLFTAPPERSWWQPLQRPNNPKRKHPPIDFTIPWEPSLFTAPPELSWFQPASLPNNPKRKMPLVEFALTLEQSLFPVNDLSWFQPACQPNNPKPKHPPTQFVTSWEPSVFTEPPPLSWFQPASEPTRRLARMGGTEYTKTNEPSSTESPPPLSWEPHLSQPAIARPRPLHEAFHAVFVVQAPAATDIAWYQQASEPTRRSPRMGGSHFTRPAEPSLTEAPPPLSWFQPASQPAIRLKRSRTLTWEVRPLIATTFIMPSIAKYIATDVRIEGTTYIYLQPLHNLQAAVAPTTTDDGSIGYAPGSIWIDKTLDNAYICVSAVSSAAVWKQID